MSEDRTGVLFDVDGTLVDTTYLHAVCWAEAVRQHGHVIPMANIHHLIGMAGDGLLDELLGEQRDRDDDDALTDAHLTLYRQHWGRLVPLPGAAKLLPACSDRGHSVVLASSASDAWKPSDPALATSRVPRLVVRMNTVFLKSTMRP